MDSKNSIPSFSLTVWLQVMHSVLDVEQPLVQDQLRDINAQLKKAEGGITWNNKGQDSNRLLQIWL